MPSIRAGGEGAGDGEQPGPGGGGAPTIVAFGAPTIVTFGVRSVLLATAYVTARQCEGVTHFGEHCWTWLQFVQRGIAGG